MYHLRSLILRYRQSNPYLTIQFKRHAEGNDLNIECVYTLRGKSLRVTPSVINLIGLGSYRDQNYLDPANITESVFTSSKLSRTISL